MSEGERPGGLTALAMVNFVFGGIGLLSSIGFVAMIAVFSQTEMANAEMEELKGAQMFFRRRITLPLRRLGACPRNASRSKSRHLARSSRSEPEPIPGSIGEDSRR